MNGIFFQIGNFWIKLHEVFDTLEEGKKVTKEFLFSDYGQLVEEVCNRLWKGKDAQPYFELINSIRYFKGVGSFLKKLKEKGYVTIIITCAPKPLVERLKRDYPGMIDYAYYNDLPIENGKVKGTFYWQDVAEGKEKKAILVRKIQEKEGIPKEDTIALADGDTDLEMCLEASKFIAFNGQPGLREKTPLNIEGDDISKVLEHF